VNPFFLTPASFTIEGIEVLICVIKKRVGKNRHCEETDGWASKNVISSKSLRIRLCCSLVNVTGCVIIFTLYIQGAHDKLTPL
jgi:formate/nitrite transporter FocA (FNT family)